MKGSKTKNEMKSKVIENKINNPDKKLREISNETGLPISTVADIIQKDLPEVCKSSEKIANLIDINDNLQSLADARIEKMIKNEEESIRLSELISLRTSTFNQNQLIQGKATSNVNIIGDIVKDIQGQS